MTTPPTSLEPYHAHSCIFITYLAQGARGYLPDMIPDAIRHGRLQADPVERVQDSPPVPN